MVILCKANSLVLRGLVGWNAPNRTRNYSPTLHSAHALGACNTFAKLGKYSFVYCILRVATTGHPSTSLPVPRFFLCHTNHPHYMLSFTSSINLLIGFLLPLLGYPILIILLPTYTASLPCTFSNDLSLVSVTRLYLRIVLPAPSV